MQTLADKAGLRGLSVYICNFDLPLQDIHASRVPAVPANLITVMKVKQLDRIPKTETSIPLAVQQPDIRIPCKCPERLLHSLAQWKAFTPVQTQLQHCVHHARLA